MLLRVYMCHSNTCSSFVLAGAHNDAILYNWCFDAVAYVSDERARALALISDHEIAFDVRKMLGLSFALVLIDNFD